MSEQLILALKKDWDYPPHPSEERGHFVGRRDELDRLVGELLRKDSGSFLISGARGVGKTSLVYQALREIKEKSAKKLISVFINASQLEPPSKDSKSADVLSFRTNVMKNLIRRTYTALRDPGKVDSDANKTIEELYKKAVASTFEIKEEAGRVEVERQEETQESKLLLSTDIRIIVVAVTVFLATLFQFATPFSNELINKILPLVIALFGGLALIFTWSRVKKKSIERTQRQEATEVYKQDNSLSNLEYDFEILLEKLLKRGNKLVFVIDELDKVDAEQVIDVIKTFKRLFTLSSAIFVFITGPEVYEKIEEKSNERPVEYTLFAQRMFLSRPRFSDLEIYIDEISLEVDALQNSEGYGDFRNYLCFDARTDYSDLQNLIRDIVTVNSSAKNEEVEQKIQFDSKPTQVLKSRFQKAMGQVYDGYKSQQPSQWRGNDNLLTDLYAFLHELVNKGPGFEFDDNFGQNTQANCKRDLCVYFARLGAVNKLGTEARDVEGEQIQITRYQTTGTCKPVPDTISTLLDYENKFMQSWESFVEILPEIANIHQASQTESLFSQQDLENDPEKIFQLISELAALDCRSLYTDVEPYVNGLRSDRPSHFPREELENASQRIEQLVNALRTNSRIITENVLRGIFPDYQLSSLQNNASLFSAIINLREALINSGTEHNVIFPNDFSKQLLITKDIDPGLIKQNKRLLWQNRDTYNILNVQISDNFQYPSDRGVMASFRNINVAEGFKGFIAKISKAADWFRG